MSDIEPLIKGLGLVREIAKSNSFKKYALLKESLPSASVTSRADIINYIKDTAGADYHFVGTCRMGLDYNNSVVNDQLQIHGMRNIRIVDASIMPTIPNSNTCAATIMIAEKAADIIKYDLS